MSMVLWGAWGLAGAFVYASPRLLVKLGNETLTARQAIMAVIETVIALIIGPIIAAGIGPAVAAHLGFVTYEANCAIAVMGGMLANPLGPLVIKAVQAGIVERIEKLFGAKP